MVERLHLALMAFCTFWIGDGGGANDVGTGHVDDWYAANAGGNGQDIAGKSFRKYFTH